MSKTKQREVAFGDLGLITYARTYSRTKKNGERENFSETVERELRGIEKQLKLNMSNADKNFYRDMRHNMWGSVAGRFMWQLGTKTVDKLGLSSLQNCAFTVIDDPIRPFTWTMDMLMLGSGVGYSIKREHVYKLPKVARKKVVVECQNDASADFIVPDTREGWVKLLGKVLKSYFYSGKGFTYSTQLVRDKGTPISGFGGVASGAGILVEGMGQICSILDNRRGKQLRPIDCLDIMNIIGSIVVAGNVRRSAQIAIGDYDDIEFLKAKRWDLGDIPNWRAMSNNSVDVHDAKLLPEEFWETYNQGEPYGLINMELARSVGRLGETEYPDPTVEGFNPCQPDFATVIIKGKGLSTFGDLKIGDEIWSKEGWTKVVNKWSTGVKPVYDFRTTSGVFTGTSNHRVDTPSGKTEVDNAESILTISGEYKDYNSSYLQDVVDGMFFGDGYFKCRDNYDKCYPLLVIGKDDYDYFDSEIRGFIKNKFQESDSRQDFEIQTTISKEEKVRSFDLRIPKRFFKNKTKLASFLKGLYTADGSVIKNKGNSCRVAYKTASKGLAEDVQLALSYLGIKSYITTNKAKKVVFDNGEYLCRESYDVNISTDRQKFLDSIGFIQKYKMKKLSENIGNVLNRDMYTSVKEKSYLGDFEVFDITVDNDSHTYWTGGLSVSNCAEQSLAPNETCCLAEIYLPNIKDYDTLKKTAITLYKVNKHSLALKSHHPETQEIVNTNMRMGIGITGVMMSNEEQLGWLDQLYKDLRAYDKRYSKKMGWNESVKLTTVKPSGCSVADTMLITSDGLLTLGEIGDVNGDKWQEHSINIAQESSEELSDKFYINGKVKTKKILTSGGIELESSLTHQYRVLRDGEYVWVSTPELKIGDILPFKVGGYNGGSIQELESFVQKKVTNSLIINQPKELNANLSWLLGLYLADGSTHNKGIRIAGDASKVDVLEKAKRIAKEEFNIDGIIYSRTKGNNSDLYLNSSNLLKWLSLNGLVKPKTKDIEIPLIIRRSPKEVISSYIDGYAAGDGSAKTRGRSFCTISKNMAKQLVVVLRAIGIDAKVRLMPPTESSYGNNMRYWISERKGRNSNKRYINNDVLKVWDELDNLGMSDFNYDTIVEISESENFTYDISVPNKHTYIAESYVNHNTLSLLAGVTAGVHPATAGQYYIRRIRMSSDSELINVVKSHGYYTEYQKNFDGTDDYSTVVVEFPCKYDFPVLSAEDVSVFDQLEQVRFMQKNWSDNSVSVTAYYKQEDLPKLREYLEENFKDNFKTLSFLLYTGHGFQQAPYEPISKEQYEYLSAKVKPIKSIEILEEDVEEFGECSIGSCPIK